MSGRAFDSSIEDLTETVLADDFRTISDVRPETAAFNNSLSQGTQRFQNILNSGADYFEIDDEEKKVGLCTTRALIKNLHCF